MPPLLQQERTGTMPERDAAIDVDNLPNIQVEKREDTAEAIEPAAVVKVKSGRPVFAYFLIVLCIGAIAFQFWQFQQQQQLLENARQRVTELETRLSSTDESMSQSSVALQVKLKELKDRTDELWQQMDKLWASAWRRNQKDINDHTEQLQIHSKKLKDAEAGLDRLEKDDSSFRGELAVIRAQVDETAGLAEQLQQQGKLTDSLKKQLAALQKSLTELEKISKSNSEWIESINAFRKQTNQTLSRLEQRINSLHPAAQ